MSFPYAGKRWMSAGKLRFRCFLR